MKRFDRRNQDLYPASAVALEAMPQALSQRSFFGSLKLAHWIILFYPIFIFSIRRQRELEELYTIDTSAILQIVANGIFGFYALIILLHKLPTLKRYLLRKPLIWFLGYIVLAGMSLVWSDRPAYTLYRAAEIFIFLILITYAMVSLRDFEKMLKFQLLWGFILVFFWHILNVRYGLSLNIMHNPLVSGSIIGILFLGWIVKGNPWRICYMLVLVSILLATSSATYLSLILGISIVLFFRRGKIRFIAFIFIILITAFMIFYGINYLDIIFWGKSEAHIKTGTGRIPVWQWILQDVVPQKPILGYSFGQGEAITRIYDFSYTGLRIIHLHNVAISSLVNLGLAGFLMFSSFFIGLLKSAMDLRAFKWRVYLLSGLMAIMLNAFSFSSITAPLSFGWIGHTMFFCMTAVLFIDKKTSAAASGTEARYRIYW